MQAIQQASGAAKQLSETKLDDESALTQLLGQGAEV
jgi:hypothetical protein